MRLLAGLASIGAGASLALLFLQCGGDESAAEGDTPLPDRVESIDTGKTDAAFVTDAPTPDATLTACDTAKPFGAPVRLAGFDPAGFRATPRMSADELTIYFTTLGDASGVDLQVATRPSLTAPFAGEMTLPQSGPANDHDPSVAADHLSLWFHSLRNGTSDIFLSSRASTSVPFGPAAPIPTVNQDTTNENHAYFQGSGSELWFISDRPGSAGFDIYRSPRARDGGAFAAPTRVPELSSDGGDFQPQPSEDGLTILFASDREGGKGSIDLWLARRPSVTASFGAPAPITELNSPNVDQAGWLSADGCRIYFSSGRETNDVNQQLFFAERPR